MRFRISFDSILGIFILILFEIRCFFRNRQEKERKNTAFCPKLNNFFRQINYSKSIPFYFRGIDEVDFAPISSIRFDYYFYGHDQKLSIVTVFGRVVWTIE